MYYPRHNYAPTNSRTLCTRQLAGVFWRLWEVGRELSGASGRRWNAFWSFLEVAGAFARILEALEQTLYMYAALGTAM